MKFWIPSVPPHASEENVDDYRAVFEVEVDVSPNVGSSGVNIESSQIVHSHVGGASLWAFKIPDGTKIQKGGRDG